MARGSYNSLDVKQLYFGGDSKRFPQSYVCIFIKFSLNRHYAHTYILSQYNKVHKLIRWQKLNANEVLKLPLSLYSSCRHFYRSYELSSGDLQAQCMEIQQFIHYACFHLGFRLFD